MKNGHILKRKIWSNIPMEIKQGNKMLDMIHTLPDLWNAGGLGWDLMRTRVLTKTDLYQGAFGV